jgi:hypothetical protein
MPAGLESSFLIGAHWPPAYLAAGPSLKAHRYANMAVGGRSTGELKRSA